MENVVGNRHKLHPCIKHERYRGSSQIRFSDGDPDSSRPWKTTNQVQCLLTHCAVPNSLYSSVFQDNKKWTGIALQEQIWVLILEQQCCYGSSCQSQYHNWPGIHSQHLQGKPMLPHTSKHTYENKPLIQCTMQVFSKCAQVRDTVGLANCGISSSIAKDMHKKQGIYGTPAMA